jgi:signal transduction histidine kinase
MDAQVAPGTAAPRWTGARVWGTAVRLVILGFVTQSALTDHHDSLTSGRHTAALVLLAVCAAGWLVWTVAGNPMTSTELWLFGGVRGEGLTLPPAVVGSTIVMGICGGVLTGLIPDSGAVAFPCAATIVFAIRFGLTWASTLTGAVIAVLVSSGLAFGHRGSVTYASLLIGLFAIGTGRRSYIQRAVQAEQLLAETRRANTEEAHAATLAERTRIAREIHDVLAHSMAALAVQLEAADALLSEGHDPARAHEYVRQAQHIAKEGLVETRRAIAALREDAPPLPDLLRALAKLYQDDSGTPVEVSLSGAPRPLSPDVGLALYRTAQEAFTNIRKHAPGARVTCDLTYDATAVELTVRNTLPDGPAEPSGGYGLTGMRERATLLNGSLTAGPDDDEWRVTVRVPYQAGGAA